MRQYINLSDLNDVGIHLVELGEGIKGFVYVSKRNVSHVFIDNSLSPECAFETLAHEMYHLKYDKTSREIGLDKQQEDSEQKANKFAVQNMSQLQSLMTI